MKVATLEKFHLRGGIKILGTQGWEKLGGGKGFFFLQEGGGLTLDDTMFVENALDIFITSKLLLKTQGIVMYNSKRWKGSINIAGISCNGKIEISKEI